MLYLEDILEVIENVPQEVRDRTTELRELDLGIQNAKDLLEERIDQFFSNAKKMKQQEREAQYEKLRKEYYRLLDDADEKVNVASNMFDSLERYTRKLDQELEKFKYELEADSPGVTEILEKRSLELDEPAKDSQKENRYHQQQQHQQQQHMVTSRSSSSSSDWKSVPSANIKKEDPGLDTHLSTNPSSSPPSSLSYTLGQIGVGSNAVAAAASQAIAATQQMQQGRRTASLKASYDAITHGVHPTDFSIGVELANAAQTALAASALPQDHLHHHQQQQQQQHSNSSNSVGAINTTGGTGSSGAGHAHQHQSSSSSSSHVLQSQTSSSNPASGSGSGTMKTGSSTSAQPASKRQKKKQILQQQQQQSIGNGNSRDGGPSTTGSTASITAADSNGSLPAGAAGAGATLAAAAAVTTTPEGSVADPSSLESPDWTFDPNEPRYCTCNQVSYGDMVACDNLRCPVEWFHYPCVGITSPPKGKWYCPQCSLSMNRRQRK